MVFHYITITLFVVTSTNCSGIHFYSAAEKKIEPFDKRRINSKRSRLVKNPQKSLHFHTTERENIL